MAEASSDSTQQSDGVGDNIGGWSLVADDPAYRLQQKLGLIPQRGLGLGRRAAVFVMASWLPIMVWAVVTGHPWLGGGADTVFGHFVLHARCLVSIPLLVFAEGIAQKALPPLGYFASSGLVPPERIERYRALLASINHLKNQVGPWVLILGVALAWAIAGVTFTQLEDFSWTQNETAARSVTFAGFWVGLVVRPLFLALVLTWLWRVLLLFLLLRRVVRLPLALLPTHPDQAAGLAFTQYMVNIFSPVALALAVVIAASFAQEIAYQGLTITQLRLEMIAAVVLLTVLFLFPFFPLALPLANLKRNGLLQYGELASHHHRLVHDKWIAHKTIDSDPILDAPELGPVADVQSIYQAVKQMRLFPFGKAGILLIAVPAALPFAVVCLSGLPVKVVLAKLMGALL